VTTNAWNYLELTAPVLIEARGPDALRYLNGQLTQDVRRVVSAEKALPSCVTDAKGRLQFRVLLHAAPDGAIRVSCEHEGADELFARLDRYLIADDATLEDVSAGWTRRHVTGCGSPMIPAGGYAVSVDRIGLPGWDLWSPGAVDSVFPAWSPAEAETQRITAGIPAWGSELTVNLLPPEAGLDRTDISYAKGCYIGQEVISRIKSAGKVNRRLMKMSLVESVCCQAGDRLIDSEGREAGVITSVAPLAVAGRRFLLGYLKRTAVSQRVSLERQPEVFLDVIGPT
jgi:tRNA-modifying protein YgfZ